MTVAEGSISNRVIRKGLSEGGTSELRPEGSEGISLLGQGRRGTIQVESTASAKALRQMPMCLRSQCGRTAVQTGEQREDQAGPL